MPETTLDYQKFQAVQQWIKEQGGVVVDPGNFIVNEEPLIMRGLFEHLVTLKDLMHFRFRYTTSGEGQLYCSENHARDMYLDGVLDEALTPAVLDKILHSTRQI